MDNKKSLVPDMPCSSFKAEAPSAPSQAGVFEAMHNAKLNLGWVIDTPVGGDDGLR